MERFTREEEKGEDYEKVAQESGCCLRHVTRALIWKGEKQRCFVVGVLVSGGGLVLELRCESSSKFNCSCLFKMDSEGYVLYQIKREDND